MMINGTAVSDARCGDMVIHFDIPLTLNGVDEENVYFTDCSRSMHGLPYVRYFAKEWSFKQAGTEYWFGFECECL